MAGRAEGAISFAVKEQRSNCGMRPHGGCNAVTMTQARREKMRDWRPTAKERQR